MHECFISYSRKDKEIAVAILQALEQQGIPCWIDFRDTVPGDGYAGSIVRAIKAASMFVVIVSQNSAGSIDVLREINSAANAGITMLPFKIDTSELNDDMEYYLSKTQWIDASAPPMEDKILQLVGAACARKDKGPIHPPRPSTPVSAASPRVNMECRVVKYQELLALGYTSTTIALQLVENDYINFRGIGAENEGTAQQWEEFLQNNSETFQYLVNGNNEIIGDWSIVALTKEAYEMAMQGELLEADINIETTEMICFPGIYYGYVLTFSILPQYRNMKNYMLLMESFFAQMEEYAENGIYFKAWCINVFSKEVEALVRQLGFNFVVNNKVFGKIFHCNFIPLPDLPIYRKHTALIERYNDVTF